MINWYFIPSDDYTEEMLNLHQEELLSLKKHYEDHRELFEGVTRWQDSWTLFLQLEVSTFCCCCEEYEFKSLISVCFVYIVTSPYICHHAEPHPSLFHWLMSFRCVSQVTVFVKTWLNSPQKKATDPSRFNNRGGNLLKEEKQRADLQKSLPKVRLSSVFY